jgi:uncharacterized membrane protein
LFPPGLLQSVAAFALLLLALSSMAQLFTRRVILNESMIKLVPAGLLLVLLPVAISPIIAVRAFRRAEGLSRLCAAIVLLGAVVFLIVFCLGLASSL